MKYLAVLLACLALILTACSDDSDGESPTASPPSPTPATSPTPESTATPPSGSTSPIDADNFADLQPVASATLANLDRMAWQESGELLVASRMEAALLTPGSNALQPVLTATAPNAILAVSTQSQIATSADNLSIEIHDVTGAPVATLDSEAPVGSLDFSPDGTLLAVARLDQIAVDLWDIEAGTVDQQLDGFETAAPVYSASYGADGETLIWLSRGTAQVMEIESGDLAPAVQHELFLSDAELNLDASLLVTTWANFATLWQVEDGVRLQDMAQIASAFQAAFIPDSELLVVATAEGIKLWDIATYEEVATLPGEARQIAVSPDGRYLATVDQNGAVTIWSPSS